MTDDGLGWDSISSALLPCPGTLLNNGSAICRAAGKDGLLNMGSRKKTYGYETKLAAARAHVDDGRTLQDVMADYGIARPGAGAGMVQAALSGGRRRGAEGGSLRGHSGSRAKPAPKTREQELEERVRKLEAEKRLFKKSWLP